MDILVQIQRLNLCNFIQFLSRINDDCVGDLVVNALA
jgi:hypothetical protein